MESEMSFNKYSEPEEWLRENLDFSKTEEIRTIHFDMIKGYERLSPTGLELLKYSIEIIRKADIFINDKTLALA